MANILLNACWPKLRLNRDLLRGTLRNSVSINNRLRRSVLIHKYNISESFRSLRCKTDRAINWGFTKIEHALHLSEARVEKNRAMVGKSFFIISALAKITTVPIFLATLAIPPLVTAYLPLLLIIKTSNLICQAAFRSLARKLLDNPNRNISTNELIKLAQYMRITKQRFVRIENTIQTHDTILIQLYKNLNIRKTALTTTYNSANTELANRERIKQQLDRLEIALSSLEKQLRNSLYQKNVKKDLYKILRCNFSYNEHEVASSRIKTISRFQGNDLIPMIGDETQKGVIDYLISEEFSELKTAKARVDLVEKIEIKDNPSAKHYAELLNLLTQAQQTTSASASVRNHLHLHSLSDQEQQILQHRQLNQAHCQALLSLSPHALAKHSLEQLSNKQILELRSQTPMDNTALTVEAAVRQLIHLNPNQYELEHESESHSSPNSTLTFDQILSIFEVESKG